MDWKKIDREIKQFASEHNSKVTEKDLAFVGGKITTYQFSESNKIFYQLIHLKPESESGNKFQMESVLINEEIEIIVKRNFFGKLKTKITGFISPSTKDQIRTLSTVVDEFNWTTNLGKGQFLKQKTLKFKTTDIDIDSKTMHLIRKIHLEISG